MRVLKPIRDWRLYVVTDANLSRGRSHVQVARCALAGGADVIQLRDKTASRRIFTDIAWDLRRLTRTAGAVFIVNDWLDIALSVDADGVHLGQEDFDAGMARYRLKGGKILGISVGSVEEARQAEEDGADYVSVGPVFEARSSKPDAGEPRGLELVRKCAQICQIPVLAIGGINSSNAASVIEAGACSVAVITAVTQAQDMTAAARELTEITENAKAQARLQGGERDEAD